MGQRSARPRYSSKRDSSVQPGSPKPMWSMIVVVPPQAAAAPPSKKSSQAAVLRGLLQRHVGVGVDAAGHDVLAGRIDDRVELARLETGPDRLDLLVADRQVGLHDLALQADGPVGDEGLHGGPPLGGAAARRDGRRARMRGTPGASWSIFAGPGRACYRLGQGEGADGSDRRRGRTRSHREMSGNARVMPSWLLGVSWFTGTPSKDEVLFTTSAEMIAMSHTTTLGPAPDGAEATDNHPSFGFPPQGGGAPRRGPRPWVRTAGTAVLAAAVACGITLGVTGALGGQSQPTLPGASAANAASSGWLRELKAPGPRRRLPWRTHRQPRGPPSPRRPRRRSWRSPCPPGRRATRGRASSGTPAQTS